MFAPSSRSTFFFFFFLFFLPNILSPIPPCRARSPSATAIIAEASRPSSVSASSRPHQAGAPNAERGQELPRTSAVDGALPRCRDLPGGAGLQYFSATGCAMRSTRAIIDLTNGTIHDIYHPPRDHRHLRGRHSTHWIASAVGMKMLEQGGKRLRRRAAMGFGAACGGAAPERPAGDMPL